MKRLEIIVKGKVQGVGFRFFSTTKASLLKITGFCKNLDNGDVYIEAQGSNINLENFINILKEGNKFITVSHIEKKEIPLISSEKIFKLEY